MVDEFFWRNSTYFCDLVIFLVIFLIWVANINLTFGTGFFGIFDDLFEQGSPLSYAVESGHLDIVKYLIENGADIDKTDNDVGDQADELDIFSCVNFYLPCILMILNLKWGDIQFLGSKLLSKNIILSKWLLYWRSSLNREEHL